LTQNDVERDFEENVPNEEQGETSQVLVTCDLQIRCETFDLGICNYLARQYCSNHW